MTSAPITPARILSTAVIVIVIVMVAMPVMAQRQPSPQQIEQLKTQMTERFVKADANQDGCLTRDEAKGKMPRLYQRFDEVDQDRDGYVTQADIAGYVESIVAQRR
jgi:Ca2+-binding EF-hand superfamily protein